MPSPTTPILDTFIRADENPLTAANWATSLNSGSKIVSNQCVQVTAAGYDASTWKTAQSSPNVDIYCTIQTVPAASTYLQLDWRNQNQTNLTGAYMHLLVSNTTDTSWDLALYAYDGAVDHFLDSSGLGTPFVSGDQVWVHSSGNVFTVYYNGVLKITATDTNNYAPTGSYMGILFTASCGVGLRNFGGGVYETTTTIVGIGRRIVGWQEVR